MNVFPSNSGVFFLALYKIIYIQNKIQNHTKVKKGNLVLEIVVVDK